MHDHCSENSGPSTNGRCDPQELSVQVGEGAQQGAAPAVMPISTVAATSGGHASYRHDHAPAAPLSGLPSMEFGLQSNRWQPATKVSSTLYMQAAARRTLEIQASIMGVQLDLTGWQADVSMQQGTFPGYTVHGFVWHGVHLGTAGRALKIYARVKAAIKSRQGGKLVGTSVHMTDLVHVKPHAGAPTQLAVRVDTTEALKDAGVAPLLLRRDAATRQPMRTAELMQYSAFLEHLGDRDKLGMQGVQLYDPLAWDFDANTPLDEVQSIADAIHQLWHKLSASFADQEGGSHGLPVQGEGGAQQGAAPAVMPISTVAAICGDQAVNKHRCVTQDPLGVFSLVPDSWLRQFIKCLPPESLLALFRCSKTFARHILWEADRATVNVLTVQGEALQRQRRAIKRLLLDCNHFAVRCTAGSGREIPRGFAKRVTSLSMECRKRDRIVKICGSWGALTQLQKVCLIWPEDLGLLCNAVKAGQLQQLRSLQFRMRSNQNFRSPQGVNIDDVARILGPQLEELATNVVALIEQPPQFTKLRCLILGDMERRLPKSSLSPSMLQQLCVHPTLRHVTFLRLSEVPGDSRQFKCSWDTLTLHSPRLHQLLQVPPAGVQQLQLLGSLSIRLPADLPAVQSVISQHGYTVVCQPGAAVRFSAGKAEVGQGAWEMAGMLLRRMRGLKTLEIAAGDSVPPALILLQQASSGTTPITDIVVEDITTPAPGVEQGWSRGARVLPALGPALPRSITSITLKGFKGLDSEVLWYWLPQHVTGLTLDRCSMDPDVHVDLKSSKPSHVRSLVIVP